MNPTEIIMERLAWLPTRQDLWRAALLGMTGGITATVY
jgi:hypothetical protein